MCLGGPPLRALILLTLAASVSGGVGIYNSVRVGGTVIGDYSQQDPPVVRVDKRAPTYPAPSYSLVRLTSDESADTSVPPLWPVLGGVSALRAAIKIEAGAAISMDILTAVANQDGWVTFSCFVLPGGSSGLGAKDPQLELRVWGTTYTLVGKAVWSNKYAHGGEWRQVVMVAKVSCSATARGGCSGTQRVQIVVGGNVGVADVVHIAGMLLVFDALSTSTNAALLPSATLACTSHAMCEFTHSVQKMRDNAQGTFWSTSTQATNANNEVVLEYTFSSPIPVCGVRIDWATPVLFARNWAISTKGDPNTKFDFSKPADAQMWHKVAYANPALVASSVEASIASGPGTRTIFLSCDVANGVRISMSNADGSVFKIHEFAVYTRATRTVPHQQCGTWSGITRMTPTANTLTCRHGGICLDGKCNCPQGWSGSSCAKFSCAPRPCLNGGSCIGAVRCKCLAGWHGANCGYAKCGDGHKVGTEQCDDGNLVNGDGCSAACTPFVFAPPPPTRAPTPPPTQPQGSCGLHGVRTVLQADAGRPWLMPTYICLCDAGWSGARCEAPLCNAGCGHNGMCTMPDQCTGCDEGWGGRYCGSAMPPGHMAATVFAIASAALVGVMLAELVLVFMRRAWGPFMARGITRLFVSHAGAIAWLLACMAMVLGETVGYDAAAPEKWTWWLLLLGHGAWISSNLTFMRAMCSVHVWGHAPLSLPFILTPMLGVWVGVAFARNYIVIVVWGGMLIIYSLLLTLELWPLRHQLRGETATSLMTMGASAALHLMKYHTRDDSSLTTTGVNVHYSAGWTLGAAYATLVIIAGHWLGTSARLCWLCAFASHEKVQVWLAEFEDEYRLDGDTDEKALIDFDNTLHRRRKHIAHSLEHHDRTRTERRSSRGVHVRVADHVQKHGRRLVSAVTAPARKAASAAKGALPQGLSRMVYDRNAYGQRKKVVHPHHHNHENVDDMTDAERHYWSRKKSDAQWHTQDDGTASVKQYNVPGRQVRYRSPVVNAAPIGDDARSRRNSHTHYSQRIHAVRQSSDKYGWSLPADK